MSQTILYDLPSCGNCACWSLNPWKARAALNFKGLPYKTEWIEYPDLEPTFKSLGISKNDPSTAYTDYSSPAVKLPDGRYIMDSRSIGEALDKLQPEPSLHMDRGDVIDRTAAVVGAVFTPLRAIAMPRVPDLLNQRSADYFHETRSKRFGMSLEELGKSEKAKTAWEDAEPHLKELKAVLTENKDGPYVLGKEPSFADFIVGGFFVFVKKVDRGDLYDRLMSYDSSFSEHMKACQKWFERDD
jgi:glutathione S-transferase